MKFMIIILLFLTSVFADDKEALKTIKSFGKNLKTELQNAMKKSPVHAVNVCKLKAPELTKASSNKNLQIGRVSLKNRNPDNYPREWMLETIKAYEAQKITDPYKIINLEKGRKGLLKPIPTVGLCLNCHGEKIGEDVQKAISKKYPNDKAIGYKVGDIRGYFWATFND